MKLELDSNGTFWLGIWSVGAIVLIVLTLAIMANSMNKTNNIRDLIDAGMSPIEASCAIDDGTRDPKCLVMAINLGLK